MRKDIWLKLRAKVASAVYYILLSFPISSMNGLVDIVIFLTSLKILWRTRSRRPEIKFASIGSDVPPRGTLIQDTLPNELPWLWLLLIS